METLRSWPKLNWIWSVVGATKKMENGVFVSRQMNLQIDPNSKFPKKKKWNHWTDMVISRYRLCADPFQAYHNNIAKKLDNAYESSAEFLCASIDRHICKISRFKFFFFCYSSPCLISSHTICAFFPTLDTNYYKRDEFWLSACCRSNWTCKNN